MKNGGDKMERPKIDAQAVIAPGAIIQNAENYIRESKEIEL